MVIKDCATNKEVLKHIQICMNVLMRCYKPNGYKEQIILQNLQSRFNKLLGDVYALGCFNEVEYDTIEVFLQSSVINTPYFVCDYICQIIDLIIKQNTNAMFLNALYVLKANLVYYKRELKTKDLQAIAKRLKNFYKI